MDTPARVLVMEDDEFFASMLAEQLAADGYAVHRVGDVAAGCAALAGGNAFDVVIADLHLPDTDGGVSDALLNAAGETPVILITGTPTIDSALQSMQRHVFAYRTKPFEMGAFRQTVAQAVAHGDLCRRVSEARRRYQSVDEQLAALRQLAARGDGPDVNQSLADYLRLLLGNSIESMAEALDLVQSLEGGQFTRPVRQLSRHPEAEMFRKAVEHTVELLDKTRHAFKSKELGELRRQLKLALKVASDDSHAPGR